jgi:sodium/bile acid cotransporter 7
MVRMLQRRWFLTALAALLTAGITWHRELNLLVERMPQDAIIGSVLFVMAFSLQSGAMMQALRRPAGWLIAIGVNVILLPPTAWLAGRWLAQDLADGLVIAASVPCTLGSAAVITRRAGGNDTIALLVTVVTNLACFVVTPAWVKLLTGRTGGPQQSFGELVSRLAVLVALPIVAGQLLRTLPRVGRWATRHRSALGVYAQLGILAMVLVGAVRCGQQLDRLGSGIGLLAGQLAAVAALVAAIHLAAWAVGFWAAGRAGLPREDRSAVAFAGSQKTLMIGLAIALDFGGLAVLPMMAYHVEQLLIDTLLADRLHAGKSPSGPRSMTEG